MIESVNISHLLIFGALAQMTFNMRPENLKVEYHIMSTNGTVRLARVVDDIRIFGKTQVDDVTMLRFANVYNENIFMGYSKQFNILVVGIPNIKEHE